MNQEVVLQASERLSIPDMNKGSVVIIMPRYASGANPELAAIRQLEVISRRLNVPAVLSYRNGWIWGIRSGHLEVRHEDFAECATQFVKKIGIQI